jgi:hypothetical protein
MYYARLRNVDNPIRSSAMADDEQTAADGDETTARKRTGTGLARRATRSLRRARSLYEENTWQDSTEAAFLIQEASVLALMDLADAVREQQQDSET